MRRATESTTHPAHQVVHFAPGPNTIFKFLHHALLVLAFELRIVHRHVNGWRRLRVGSSAPRTSATLSGRSAPIRPRARCRVEMHQGQHHHEHAQRKHARIYTWCTNSHTTICKHARIGMHSLTHRRIHACTYTHAHVHLHVHTRTCTCAHLHILHIYTCMYTPNHVHTRANTPLHTHVHTPA